MTLDNLVGRTLSAVPPDAGTIARLLDALRKQRHVIDYSGDLVSETMALEATAHAGQLLQKVVSWLHDNKPGLSR